MITKPDLDALLLRLAGVTETAQALYEASQRDGRDKDEEWEAEYFVWLSLEQESDFDWTCGWRVQEDEATVWFFNVSGGTPVQAAQALWKAVSQQWSGVDP